MWEIRWRTVVLVALGLGLAALGIYVSLPTVTCHPMSREAAATQQRLGVVAKALEAFKNDWGDYPPSRPEPGQDRQYGYQNLVYYLAGPTGQGWGEAIGGLTPYGGQAPGRTYGPYYTIDPSSRLPRDGGPAVCDAFPSPPRPILYFRYHADRDPPYDVRDNPVDPTCQTGFASQAHFELSAKYEDRDERIKWQRDDYLLISPGADRLYGYVVEDETSGEMRPAGNREEIRSGAATCDDITNF